MCPEYGLLAMLTVCTECRIRHLFLTVRNSAAVLDMPPPPKKKKTLFAIAHQPQLGRLVTFCEMRPQQRTEKSTKTR